MLEALPLLFALAGLVLYVLLAGADFGAAIWQITAPRSSDGRRVRDFAHHVMGPVWEANHVWLIFVLVVVWTGYPAAFGSIASTLAVALSVAAGGIVVRGAAYALSAGAADPREVRGLDTAMAVAAVLTPFALGTCVGAVASGRVPYGNAQGDLWASWLNPTSIVVGLLAVAFSAYLAAVFLCDDATRRGEHDLVAPFRHRALGAGAVAGVLAAAGLVVLHEDAPALYRELTSGGALPALLVSAGCGAATLALVARHRFVVARYSAAVAVAAVVLGWALAQRPRLLPGLTVEQAAAPHDVLVALVVAIVGGALVLLPALGLLLRMTLRGELGAEGGGERAVDAADVGAVRSPFPLAPAAATRLAAACLVGAVGLLTVAEAGWANAIGVLLALAFVPTGALAVVPALLAAEDA